jgi:hypothetical protein
MPLCPSKQSKVAHVRQASELADGGRDLAMQVVPVELEVTASDANQKVWCSEL